MIRRPPRSTQSRSSAASDVYKRQGETDLFLAVGRDRHGRNDNLKLSRLEGWDDAIPGCGHDVRFQPKLLGYGGNEVDVETRRLVGTVGKLERSERCVIADGQSAVLFDAVEV